MTLYQKNIYNTDKLIKTLLNKNDRLTTETDTMSKIKTKASDQ